MEKSIYDPAYRRLLAILAQKLKESGLKQEDVTKRVGKPQSFISKVLSGERRIDVAELRHVARAMGTTLLDIVTEFEEQERRLEQDEEPPDNREEAEDNRGEADDDPGNHGQEDGGEKNQSDEE